MSDVVILSPYREQRSKITGLLKGAYDDIQVTTVIKSQGKELQTKRSTVEILISAPLLNSHPYYAASNRSLDEGFTTIKRPVACFSKVPETFRACKVNEL